MTYLPSLIKKIDDFCNLTNRLEKTAQDYSGGYSSPDDSDEPEDESGGNPPYYDELVNLSRQVEDPELSQQLQMLAELYRYTIQLGGGYSTIATAINNLKTMYSDGSDSDIEDTLNGMIKELAKAAGGIKALSGKDNPSFVQRLAQLKQDIESRNQEERSGALDAYQEEISGKGSGAQTDESSQELAEAGLTPEQAEIVNPAALGFADKEDPKTNKGWHTTGSGKAYKNWKEYYNNEKVSYETDLASEQDPEIEQILKQLIDLLPVLSKKTQDALDLSNALRSDIANPAEEAKAREQLTALQQELQRIKYARRSLRNRVRDIQLQKEKQKISVELQEASQKYEQSVDPERKERFRREAELLKQKLALNELAQSSDVYKAKERNYRLELVRQMSGGAFPAQDWIDKQQQKINAAHELRKTKRAYDRERTEQKGKEEGRKPAERGSGRGGWAPGEKQIDIEQGSDAPTYFPLLVGKIGPGINTAVAGVSYYIAREKEGGVVELHPFIKDISNAIKKKDNAAKYAAINKLREEAKKYILRKTEASAGVNAVASYEIALRLTPYFRKIEEACKKILDWQLEKGLWSLDETQIQSVKDADIYISRVIDIYNRQYKHKKSNFDSFIKLLEAVKKYLENNILGGIRYRIQDPQTRVETEPRTRIELDRDEPPTEEEASPTFKRMRTLTRLLNKELTKRAQTTDKKVYDRIRTIEKAKQHGKNVMLGRETGRGGWSPNEKQYDYNPNALTFDGMVDLFSQRINTAIHTARQEIYSARNKGVPELKPYIDAVSTAIRRNDDMAKFEAMRELKRAVTQYAKVSTVKYERSVRIQPFFYKLRDELKAVSKWPGLADGHLSEPQKEIMKGILHRLKRLQEVYMNEYNDLFYGPALEATVVINNKLLEMIRG